MKCPNCDKPLDPDKPLAVRHPNYVHSNPNPGHGEDCMLRACLQVIADREDHDLTGIRLEAIDIDAFWERIGPVVDATEKELGLTPDLNNPGPRGKEKVTHKSGVVTIKRVNRHG